MADLTGQYYPSQGSIGYGVQILVGDGTSPEQFEAIPFVKRITPGEMSTSVIDRTHLRSPARHREKRAGIRDSGPFTVQMIYTPKHESQSSAGGGAGVFADGGIIAWWIEAREKNFQIVLSDGSPETLIPFRGVITRFQIGEIGLEEEVLVEVDMTPLQDFSSQIA